MGTAYTAVGRDAGYIDYNPAGSALLPSSELALYHHAWIADSNLEGVVYTVRFGNFGMGIGGKFLSSPSPPTTTGEPRLRTTTSANRSAH